MSSPTQPTIGTKRPRHKHYYAAIPWRLGQYGRQDIHIHSCIEDLDDDGSHCDRVLVGPGRNCNRDDTHVRRTLGQGSWSARENEGKPLSPMLHGPQSD